MASLSLMYFLIILLFRSLLTEGRALKRTQREPNISADFKVYLKIIVCQIIMDNIDIIQI
ncbi:exocrine gland-secreted peptide 1-like [Grammomys surdaster]|uniref:exocrine gland-secreted peptide 1-like n=1 Tax=Grammomys surdaster TaxID=491861 RepID=UPI00109F6E3E|nr:exocrine gland-secreted peptide 1-like [Grammomys surdaster]